MHERSRAFESAEIMGLKYGEVGYHLPPKDEAINLTQLHPCAQ